MTEFWKSNPRHFCTFCKCWIADNKPSRDFHEKGKKHQENVQRKISDVRKKSVKDAEKKEEENSYMKEMEQAARKAFLKDLKSDPKLAEDYRQKALRAKATVESKTSAAESRHLEMSSAAKPKAAKGEGDEAPKAPTCSTQGTWQIAHSPEGYPYYWNDVTAEVSWTKPEGVEEADDTSQTAAEVLAETAVETAAETADEAAVEAATATANETAVEEADTEEEQSTSQSDQLQQGEPLSSDPIPDLSDISAIPLPGECLPSASKSSKLTGESVEASDEPEAVEKLYGNKQKRAHDSAYGGWEEVAQEEAEQVDLELPQVEEVVEQKVITLTEPKVKFRQKKVDTLGAELVAFKKRKMNSRSLKQRMDS